MAKSLIDRAIEILGGIPKGAHSKATRRAYEAGFDDGNDEPPSGDLKSFGYRRATAGSVRDFGGLDYETVQNTAWRVFLMSPVAKRYVQLKRDYELGRGVEPSSDDPALGEILETFWQVNKLDSRLKEFAAQWHLLGEQMYPVFVRATDGQVRLGYIDPSEIESVIQHPDNCLERWAVVLKPLQADYNEPWRKAGTEKRVYRIVREAEPVVNPETEEAVPGEVDGKLITAEQATLEQWEAEMLPSFGLDSYTGTCFYFPRNALSNQPRGYTDLLQVADWIDQDEGVLFDLADRENIAGHFLVDVTANGLNDDEILEKASKLRSQPPKKGSINIHNDQETWSMIAPDLKQSGSVETHRALLTHVMGGQGLPNHWYGYGDETNRATAQAQGDPTWRTMETDQDSISDMVMALLEFARDQAIIAGAYAGEGDITLRMPEMTMKDIVAISSAMSQVSLALAQAVDAGWMADDSAREVWSKIVAEIGVEIDPEEEAAKIEKSQQSGALGQQADANSWFVQHGLAVDEEPQGVPVTFGGND